MHVMNFESVELFFAIYLQLLYLAGKRQTQQNCKHTVRHFPQWLEKITSDPWVKPVVCAKA